MKQYGSVLSAAIIAIGLSSFANGTDLPEDATTAEAAAYAVLDKHCARCHQDGRLLTGLSSPKSGFGHVLDVRRLESDTKFVIQGKAFDSYLFQAIGQGGYPQMPDDCKDAACFPNDAEMDKLKAWIDGLGSSNKVRDFVGFEKLNSTALKDLQSLPSTRTSRVRYLSLRPLHNDSVVTTENFEAYRDAAIKLLNALSWNPEPFKFQQVDDDGLLIRIDLTDLDWTADTWRLLEERYPFGVDSETDTSLQQLQYLAETKLPILRADWFAATASVSPLYYDILELPDTVAGLEHRLGIDLVANIENEKVIRAGFQNSGVSTNNRLIERHALSTGFFWTSYDFAGSVGRQSFFEFPLGPNTAFPAEIAFEHDGGESIFTLPNGFHAYYLNTADGARLDVGPTSIVRDDDYTDGTGEVVNGISCISCHSKGMRFNEDKVRDVAINNRLLSAELRQFVDAIYPGQKTVRAAMDKDMEAFLSSLKAAGLDPESTAGGLEPVRGLFVYHVDAYIDFAKAASELGLTADELTARASFVGSDLANLLLRLQQAPIARDEWTAVFPALLERVTDYTPISPEYAVVDPTSLSYSSRNLVDQTQSEKPAAYRHSGASTSTALTIYADKDSYRVGDRIRLIVEPRNDCKLTLINIDDDGDSCVLFPHPGLPDNPIVGGTQFVFPPTGGMIAAEAGLETVQAICNGSKEAIHDELRNTSQVSCDLSQRTNPSEAVGLENLKELFVLDVGGEEKTSKTGSKFNALSSHNPDIAKARLSIRVEH